MTLRFWSAARRTGRALLWLALLLLLVRGAIALVSPTAQVVAPASFERPEPAFPDDEARAFALGFARTFLTFAPGREEEQARVLADYLAPGVDDNAGLVPPQRGQGEAQAVVDTTVARVHPLGPDAALVTVAAVLAPTARTIYLSIPVARDAAGRLAVFDAPAPAPPPGRSFVPVRRGAEYLGGAQGDAVTALLRRFFPAYLAGPPGELAYFLQAGVRLRAVGGTWTEVDLAGLELAGRPRPGALALLVTVRARDEATGALFLFRYRTLVVRDGRWYVASVNGDPKGS